MLDSDISKWCEALLFNFPINTAYHEGIRQSLYEVMSEYKLKDNRHQFPFL